VGAREDRNPEHIDILLNRRLDDVVGRFVQPRVDDLEPGIPEGPRDDVGTTVVTVQPDFRNQTPDRSLFLFRAHSQHYRGEVFDFNGAILQEHCGCDSTTTVVFARHPAMQNGTIPHTARRFDGFMNRVEILCVAFEGS